MALIECERLCIGYGAKIVAKDTVVGGFKRRQAERAKMAATKSSNDNATEA